MPVLTLITADPALAAALRQAESDIASVTRAQEIVISDRKGEGQRVIGEDGRFAVVLD